MRVSEREMFRSGSMARIMEQTKTRGPTLDDNLAAVESENPAWAVEEIASIGAANEDNS